MVKKLVKKGGDQASKLVGDLSSKYGSKLALRDLILFAVLSLISYILYLVSGSGIFQDTFYLLAMIFGFMALAFLIVWLSIGFARGKVKPKKKRKAKPKKKAKKKPAKKKK